jgi:predicted nucleic acid-binding protein
MRFWDTSALVPLFVSEAASETMAQLYRADPQIAVAWTAAIECTSACVRQHREGRLTDAHLTQLLARLDAFSRSWNLAEPSTDVRVGAQRLVARHGLRAGDAIQLASAMATAAFGAVASEFVCLDRRLMLAATAEGLRVVPELSA